MWGRAVERAKALQRMSGQEVLPGLFINGIGEYTLAKWHINVFKIYPGWSCSESIQGGLQIRGGARGIARDPLH